MKKIDPQELSKEPGPVAEQIEKGESFALTYRGRVIAELRRSGTPAESEVGGLDQLLSRADLLRTELERWQREAGVAPEDSTETLHRLRDERAATGMH